jgi:hypothetical protein
MNSEFITKSAALYFAAEQTALVPLQSFERARDMFREYGLSPILFTASGREFLPDDCYVLAERGGDLVMWGELLPARAGELTNALRSGQINDLELDSPRAGAIDRSDWHAKVGLSAFDGTMYVGMDDKFIPDLASLVCRALAIATNLVDVRYGIAYKSGVTEYPDGYAHGFVKTLPSEVFEMIRHRREWDKRRKCPTEIWSDELHGQQRHLRGLFRGAYPANVLSESHVRAADLLSHPVGKLSRLDSALWLWELGEREIPEAQAMLEAKKLLVSQADRAEGDP